MLNERQLTIPQLFENLARIVEVLLRSVSTTAVPAFWLSGNPGAMACHRIWTHIMYGLVDRVGHVRGHEELVARLGRRAIERSAQMTDKLQRCSRMSTLTA